MTNEDLKNFILYLKGMEKRTWEKREVMKREK